jgi:hypothetical protein
MHYELLYPSQYLKSSDLKGRDVALTIESIAQETLEGQKGKKEKKVVVYFAEVKAKPDEPRKRLVLNITNARTVAALYGSDTDGWKGKRVTLFSATVDGFGKAVDAVRIRPTAPPQKSAANAPQIETTSTETETNTES